MVYLLLVDLGLLKNYARTATVGTVFPGEHEPAGASEKGGLTGAAAAWAGCVLFIGGFCIFGHRGLSDFD